jgi:hypothetical protein
MGAIFMMKFNTKLAIALVAATTSVFGLASGAMAGEGGAAGAAAFTIDTNGKVTGVAVASAIGKNDASAYAYNDVTGQTNTAGALGSGGLVTLTNTTPGEFTIVGHADASLGTAQNNQFAATTTVSLGTAANDPIVKIAP